MITNVMPPSNTTPRNLLDNSNFTRPINQREQTAWTANGAYTIDRWMLGTVWAQTQSASLSNVGLTFVQGIFQRFETSKSELAGKTLTAARADASGKITTSIIELPTTIETNASYGANGAYLRWLLDSIMEFRFESGKSTTLRWAALYEGAYTAETLPPYVPPAPDLELIKCQKYYWQVHFDQYETIGMGYESPAYSFVQLSAPAQMRTKYPTLTQSAPVRLGNNDRIFTNANCNGTAIILGLNYPQIATPAGSVYAYSPAAGGVTFSLSAEL